MSEQQRRQKVESAVRRFLKRVIRNGGTLPNGKHPVIDSEVYRLLSIEMTKHFSQQQAEPLSVDAICDRLMPLIHSRSGSHLRRPAADTIEFNNQRGIGETVLV